MWLQNKKKYTEVLNYDILTKFIADTRLRI